MREQVVHHLIAFLPDPALIDVFECSKFQSIRTVKRRSSPEMGPCRSAITASNLALSFFRSVCISNLHSAAGPYFRRAFHNAKRRAACITPSASEGKNPTQTYDALPEDIGFPFGTPSHPIAVGHCSKQSAQALTHVSLMQNATRARLFPSFSKSAVYPPAPPMTLANMRAQCVITCLPIAALNIPAMPSRLVEIAAPRGRVVE
jgi:hypothetical protein